MTLRYLGGQRGRNGDKIELLRAVMNGHLAAFALILAIGITLIAEFVQGESAVHQHPLKFYNF